MNVLCLVKGCITMNEGHDSPERSELLAAASFRVCDLLFTIYFYLFTSMSVSHTCGEGSFVHVCG